MLLKNKNAIIYGGSGAVGSTVALAFAREGANIFLAGRTMAKLEAVAKQITATGAMVEIAVLDVLDEKQVTAYLNKIAQAAGSIDISFNAIGLNDWQGEPLTGMGYEKFVAPVITAMKSYYITSTAAVKYMQQQGSGVILAITANAARKPYPDTGGFGVACAAIEGYCRQLAVETGKYGIRVACIRSAGSPDAPGVNEVFNQHAENAGIPREEFEKDFAEKTMLKRLPKLYEIANAAVLISSDLASAMTAIVINATCGELAD